MGPKYLYRIKPTINKSIYSWMGKCPTENDNDDDDDEYKYII